MHLDTAATQRKAAKLYFNIILIPHTKLIALRRDIHTHQHTNTFIRVSISCGKQDDDQRGRNGGIFIDNGVYHLSLSLYRSPSLFPANSLLLQIKDADTVGFYVSRDFYIKISRAKERDSRCPVARGSESAANVSLFSFWFYTVVYYDLLADRLCRVRAKINTCCGFKCMTQFNRVGSSWRYYSFNSVSKMLMVQEDFMVFRVTCSNSGICILIALNF